MILKVDHIGVAVSDLDQAAKLYIDALGLNPNDIEIDTSEEQKVKMPDMVSVELNGRIVRRDEFADTVLKHADKVEFLYFMGGGSESH